jgi:hypothetical protein
MWKKCEFDNRYEISCEGKIRRLCKDGTYNFIKPSMINKNKTHPYYYIQVSKNRIRCNHLIHRLVALAFCEGHSKENNICDHIDRNTLNNHYTNLRWGTQKDNMNNLVFNHTKESFKAYQKLQQKKRLVKITCEQCGRTFSKVNLSAHKKSKIHLNSLPENS